MTILKINCSELSATLRNAREARGGSPKSVVPGEKSGVADAVEIAGHAELQNNSERPLGS